MTLIGEIKGADGLAAMLKALPGKVQQDKVLARALKKGAAVIRDAAKANLLADGSVDTGLLADTMRISQKKEDAPGLVEVSLKPSSAVSMVVRKSRWSKTPVRARPSKYAHFVEFGTEHSAAAPFMRPAVDTKGPEAAKVIETEVLAGVAAEARKIGLPVK